jgi:acetone carboxylase gamma subunit
VDADATVEERLRRRRERLGGREPAAKRDVPLGGRRLSSGLVAVDATVHCRHCGAALGDVRANVKSALALQETSVGYRWPLVDDAPGAARFVFRRFHCPNCATQLDAEVNLAGEPFIHALEVSA